MSRKKVLEKINELGPIVSRMNAHAGENLMSPPERVRGWAHSVLVIGEQVAKLVGAEELSFGELARANLSRCVTDFNHPLEDWSIAEWTNAVAGEAGEACNAAKKVLRHRDRISGNVKMEDRDEKRLRRKVASELADTIIYADLTIQALGLDTAEVVRITFNKKSEAIESSVFLRPGEDAERREDEVCGLLAENERLRERVAELEGLNEAMDFDLTAAKRRANDATERRLAAEAESADLRRQLEAAEDRVAHAEGWKDAVQESLALCDGDGPGMVEEIIEAYGERCKELRATGEALGGIESNDTQDIPKKAASLRVRLEQVVEAGEDFLKKVDEFRRVVKDRLRDSTTVGGAREVFAYEISRFNREAGAMFHKVLRGKE